MKPNGLWFLNINILFRGTNFRPLPKNCTNYCDFRDSALSFSNVENCCTIIGDESFGEHYIDKSSSKERPNRHVKGSGMSPSFLKRTLKEALWEPWQSNCIQSSSKRATRAVYKHDDARPRILRQNFSSRKGDPGIRNTLLPSERESLAVSTTRPIIHSRSGF